MTIEKETSLKINCREYVKTDLEYVQSLMSELGYSVTKDDLSINIKEIQKREGGIFVAEINNKLIGCICSMIDVRLAEGVSGEIVSLVVSEDFRGLGVGKRLVKCSEQWLCKHVGRIRVRANEIRTNAHSFYRKIGYKEIKNQKVFLKSL